MMTSTFKDGTGSSAGWSVSSSSQDRGGAFGVFPVFLLLPLLYIQMIYPVRDCYEHH